MYMLTHLRTSPPPTLSPNRPLIPGAPPPSSLPHNPVAYLQVAIDSIAPLVKIVHFQKAAGGGMALPVPFPLSIRQRRRIAIRWILDAASKKPNRGSGKAMFGQRVAEEIIGVVQGTSGLWDKRNGQHKQATAVRANVGSKGIFGISRRK